MSNKSNWPPALKQFVNETFAKCTDANRQAVETELKQAIYHAFQAGDLWSTDWAKYKLDTSVTRLSRFRGFVPTTPAANGVAPGLSEEQDRRAKRARRFDQPQGSSTGSAGSTPDPDATYDPVSAFLFTPLGDLSFNVIDWDQYTIVGRSTKLEKPYLRLTSLPDPNTIRPLDVLKQTLELLKRKWREESNYNWVCDQFKSMRQDLIVQRIQNDFTVQVYEIHARIALEKGDLGEFNQCQSRLRHLYRLGLNGHPMEFLGYRILYLLFSRNRAELNNTLAELTPDQYRDRSVSHALAVRLAVSQGNYTKLFRLFNAAPKMGAYVMDHFVPRERVSALVTMCKAYLQIPVSLITSQLAFESDEQTHEFLVANDAALYKAPSSDPKGAPALPLGPRQLDCKAAFTPLNEVMGKMSKADLKGQI
ncbi:hypothetical protein RHOSPDRAFT_19172 [Rhodotorula sp. JG-1b]|nr:hypothetical protein RHOSPDRAFT_19172 [Rhodotorula sp. JG-1b]